MHSYKIATRRAPDIKAPDGRYILKGHLCGYVGIPQTHPLFGLGFDEEHEYLERPDHYLDVHGGITYAGGTGKYPIETEEPTWWFGFDCGHIDDEENPKDEAFVLAQCEHLAEQLFAIEEYNEARSKSKA